MITYGFEGNGSAPGDSGGSLICSKDGVEYVVGVIVGGVTSNSEGYASNVTGRF